jgi:hypothetical protein
MRWIHDRSAACRLVQSPMRPWTFHVMILIGVSTSNSLPDA